ncbi:hypothetical protein EC968_003770 [Mortierella alpina]|nr:hypothetical protein EC968_003770 [Mortierella alpina]
MTAQTEEKTLAPPPPTRDSTVTLREINKENWRAITDLKVSEIQTEFLSTNLKSLCESHYSEDAWVRGIYADETPVGFLMLSLWEPDEWYCVWRFMIDEKFQGLGFGRKAILLAIAHVKEAFPKAKLMRLYTAGPEGLKGVEANYSPYKFYAALGFKNEGEYDEYGKIDMTLDI